MSCATQPLPAHQIPMIIAEGTLKLGIGGAESGANWTRYTEVERRMFDGMAGASGDAIRPDRQKVVGL